MKKQGKVQEMIEDASSFGLEQLSLSVLPAPAASVQPGDLLELQMSCPITEKLSALTSPPGQ